MAIAPPLSPSVSPDAERRLAALARWRKRSSLVRFYRRALPGAMALIVLFGVGWVAVRELAAEIGAPESAGTIHLLNPRFYGRNDKGQPYVMSAQEAVRDGADPDRIALVRPVMSVEAGNPQPETVMSERGTYHERARLLDLFGDVRASDGQGDHFASAAAHVDMPKNSVTGQTPVSGYGPRGTFSAAAYAIYDKGDRVVLIGNVHTHLLNSPAPKPAAAETRTRS